MDVAAWNRLLDNTYGPTRGPHTPVAFEVALLETSDPASELVGVGYARPTIDSDDWLPAEESTKTSTYAPDFGSPTGPWATVRFFALVDGSTVWNICPLTEPLTVTGAGDAVTVLLAIAAGGVFEG